MSLFPNTVLNLRHQNNHCYCFGEDGVPDHRPKWIPMSDCPDHFLLESQRVQSQTWVSWWDLTLFFFFSLHNAAAQAPLVLQRVCSRQQLQPIFISRMNRILFGYSYGWTAMSPTSWGSSHMSRYVMWPGLIMWSDQWQSMTVIQRYMWKREDVTTMSTAWWHNSQLVCWHYEKDSWGVAPGLNCFSCLCVCVCVFLCPLVFMHTREGARVWLCLCDMCVCRGESMPAWVCTRTSMCAECLTM